LTEGNLRVFNRAVLKDGLRPTEAGTNPFFLIAQTVPLAINILAHRDCPIKPFGAVNTRNTFRFINPSAIRDWKTLVAASKLGQISYSAVFGGPGHPGRRQKRGVEFCITIDVRHGKETILKQDLWFLQSLPRFYKPIYQEAAADGVQLVAADVQQDRSKANGRALRISGRDPRRWAATSKDYNPIHVSAMGAKLFGFKSVIAHGNHVVALAVQQLVDAKTDEEKAAKARVWETDAAFEIEAKFLRPTTLPASLTADWSMQSGDQDAIALNVRGREKLNVTAVVRPTVTEKLS
jgi:acyl dehydratase